MKARKGTLPALRDITNNKFSEDERIPNCRILRRNNEVARERWDLLAKALLGSCKPCVKSNVNDISVRRFTSFDLIKPTQKEVVGSISDNWLEYSTKIFGKTYRIQIHHLQKKLTPKELIGFNNTGNVCIWPSEEVLAYYLLSNLDLFGGKLVLEVGGGMSCLAGLMLGCYGQVKRVDLTDGNSLSVENVTRIIKKNKLDANKVKSFHLDWADHHQLTEKYDLVLSSDCLFFDETRSDLLETIWHSLKDDGLAILTAPKRGITLNSFLKMAESRGFKCILKAYYEDAIWQQHLKFQNSCPEYDENLHYPLLLLLRKTDYWVSQGRKFCEFCKCSIADNKPSIQFHENGKKHKENVAKRLTEMQKKATKEAKDAVNFDKEMKRIEAAALKAYENDVKSNADFTSQLIRAGVETLPTPEIVEPDPKPKVHKKPMKKPMVVKKWMEAVSENGKSYYWNVDTGESAWEPPPEGYMSLAEQQRQKSSHSSGKNSHKGKKHKKPGKTNFSKDKDKISATAVVGEDKKPVNYDPIPYAPPYGKWQKITIKEQKPIDLQLPKQEMISVSVPKLREQSEKSFKERIPTPGFTASSTEQTVFKKRKIAAEVKKNMRQRLNED